MRSPHSASRVLIGRPGALYRDGLSKMRTFDLPGIALPSSVIGLGTGSYGTAIPEDRALELLDAFAGGGGNHVDTAHVYAAWAPDGAGASERTIGKWLASRSRRSEMLIATKGAHHDLKTYQKRMTRQAVAQDLAESLDRLGTDYVDLYWLHRDDEAVPAAEILGWLNEHVRAGLIRAIGCSNWSVARQREAAGAAAEGRLVGFAASQVRWSLAAFHLPPGDSGSGMVAMDDEMLAWHAETHVPVVAYSAQAGGFFSGRYAGDTDPAAPGVRKGVLTHYACEANFRRLAAARALADEHGCTANQVALAWLLGQPFGVCALCGCRTVAQLADSCAAADVTLSAADVARLSGA